MEFQSTVESGELIEQANRWLARFAPLISQSEVPFELETIRSQIATLTSLRSEAPNLVHRLSEGIGEQTRQLLDTINQANGQLESIENDLRRQLAKVAPGDPMGMVDVQSLQDRLAERQAKQEIGVQGADLIPGELKLETSPPNVAIAAGMGIFGLGWTAFTTLHCVLMVGGFSKAFGWGALGLLAFYAIFFFAGFAMLGAAFNALCVESITLNGRHLVVQRKFGGWIRTKSYDLAPTTQATVGTPQMETSVTSENSKPVFAINLTDIRGKGISFGTSTTREYKEQMARIINDYLAARG